MTQPRDARSDGLQAVISVLEIVRQHPSEYECQLEDLFTAKMLRKDMGRDYMVDWGVYGRGMRIGGRTKTTPIVAVFDSDTMVYRVHTVKGESRFTRTGQLRRDWIGRWRAEEPNMTEINEYGSVPSQTQ
jgi:hypothetical protein